MDDMTVAAAARRLMSAFRLPEAVKVFEDACIDAALDATCRNVTEAARRLGIHRNSLHRKLLAREGRL